MDIFAIGHACFKIKGKSTSLIIDPFDPSKMGLKLPKDLEADIVLVTHNHFDHNNAQAVGGSPVVVNGPGEYDIKGAAITGVASFHDKTSGSERGKNTIYHIFLEGLNIVHLGDLGHTLTQEQIEEIGLTDILMVPVGSVFTIDAKDATEVVSQLEPRIIIPMHYKTTADTQSQLDPVEKFLKEMGKEAVEPVSKLSITKDKLPEEPQVVVIE